MQATPSRSETGSPVAFGIVLVIVGIVALAMQQSGVDVIQSIERAGWPFFVIIPGLALLAVAWIPAPPQGLGFATAGAIVTTVGLILMYGDATGHWERWSYLWALLPGAAGVASIVYGAVSARRDLILVGLRTVLVASVLFVAGMWFFETTFETGQAPIDLTTWWPAILIALGALVMLSALLTRQATRNGARPNAIAPASSQEEQQ